MKEQRIKAVCRDFVDHMAHLLGIERYRLVRRDTEYFFQYIRNGIEAEIPVYAGSSAKCLAIMICSKKGCGRNVA